MQFPERMPPFRKPPDLEEPQTFPETPPVMQEGLASSDRVSEGHLETPYKSNDIALPYCHEGEGAELEGRPGGESGLICGEVWNRGRYGTSVSHRGERVGFEGPCVRDAEGRPKGGSRLPLRGATELCEPRSSPAPSVARGHAQKSFITCPTPSSRCPS